MVPPSERIGKYTLEQIPCWNCGKLITVAEPFTGEALCSVCASIKYQETYTSGTTNDS